MNDLDATQVKVIFLGDQYTGKTKLIHNLDITRNETEETANDEFFTLIEIPSEELENTSSPVMLKVWELSSGISKQEEELAYRGALFCIITLDICNPESAQSALQKWAQLREQRAPDSVLFVVGTHLDEADRRRVELKEISKACAKKDAIYVEVSNTTQANVPLFRKLFKQRLNYLLHRNSNNTTMRSVAPAATSDVEAPPLAENKQELAKETVHKASHKRTQEPAQDAAHEPSDAHSRRFSQAALRSAPPAHFQNPSNHSHQSTSEHWPGSEEEGALRQAGTHNKHNVDNADAKSSSAPSTMAPGSIVEANFGNAGEWLPGVILRDYGNGMHYQVEVTMPDGSTRRKFITVDQATGSVSTAETGVEPSAEQQKAEVGAEGKSVASHAVPEHSYFAHTPVSQSPVTSSPKRMHARKPPPADMSGVKIGDVAEARHHQKWIPVRIETRNEDGSFDVTPLVGKTQKLHHAIPASHLRPKEASGLHPPGAEETSLVSQSAPALISPSVSVNTSPVAIKLTPAEVKAAEAEPESTTSAAAATATKNGSTASNISSDATSMPEPKTTSLRLGRAFQRGNSKQLEEEEGPLLPPGTQVEANFGSAGEWLPGVILRDFGNGFHYQVEVTRRDGSVVTCKLKRKCLRVSGESTATTSESQEEEEPALEPSASEAAPAVSVPANSTSRSDSPVDNSADNTPQTPRNSLAVPVSSTTRQATARKVGSRVEANFRGKGRWFPAAIQSINRDLTYDVVYDDGEEEEGVVLEFLRALEPPAPIDITASGSAVDVSATPAPTPTAAKATPTVSLHASSAALESKPPVASPSTPSTPSTPLDSPRFDTELKAGDKVECNHEGKGHWVVGKLERVRDDGTYDIDYENGQRETRVISVHIRRPRPTPRRESSLPRRETIGIVRRESSLVHAAVYTELMKVEGNYQGKGKWKTGHIAHAKMDGTYTIFYDDGDYEDSVRTIFIRALDANKKPSHTPSAPENALSLHSLQASLHSAISSIPESQTPRSTMILSPVSDSSDLLSEISPQNPTTPVGSFSSPLKGGRTYRLAGSNGTDAPPSRSKVEFREPLEEVKFLVKDESEKSLSPIRPAPVAQPLSKPQPSSRAPTQPTEANYRNKDIWLSVKTLTERADGLVDVIYADDEIERGISRDRIRVVAPPKQPTPAPAPEQVTVEVNYHNKGTWLRAKILRESDGLLDVVYEDGETERGVQPKLIRSILKVEEKNPLLAPSQSGEPQVGDRVSANYHQTGEWSAGAVTNKRPDGSVDVLYDSGEFEIRVGLDNVRLSGKEEIRRGAPLARAPSARGNSAGASRRPVPGLSAAPAHVSFDFDADSNSRRATSVPVGALRTPQNSTRWDATMDTDEYEDQDTNVPGYTHADMPNYFSKHRNTLDISRAKPAVQAQEVARLKEEHKEVVAEKDAEISTLSNEVQDLRANNAELQDGIAHYRTHCAALNDEMNMMKTREQNLLRQLKAQGQQLARLAEMQPEFQL